MNFNYFLNFHKLILCFALIIFLIAESGECKTNKLYNTTLRFHKLLVDNPLTHILGSLKSINELENSLEVLDSLRYEKLSKLYKNIYIDKIEARKRLIQFKNTLKLVIKSHLDYIKGKSSYVLGINQFSNWNDDELSRGLMDKEILMDDGTPWFDLFYYLRGLADQREPNFANEVDWRKTNCIGRAKDQKSCGSCYAFASTSILDFHACMIHTSMNQSNDIQKFELSQQELIDCSKETLGCDGGLISKALNYYTELGVGIKDSCYKYTATSNGICYRSNYIYDENCLVNLLPREKTRIKISSLAFLNELEEHLQQHGPIAAAMYSSKELRYYYRGILEESENDTIYEPHAVTIVGMGTENGKKYWLIKNSWSTIWGNGGYVKLIRGRNAYDIEYYAHGILYE